MQIYLVGGAVRDTLLGLPVKDRDWVVVGATPQELVDQGFVPVGKDFPVFLHPRSKQQYALARTERKIAPGYRGFAIHAAADVTLEQDLARRDLTINALAVAAEFVDADGNFEPAQVVLTDPHHGQRDLRDKQLRHVSDAFREDPVRILRVARFAARLADFQVAAETMDLMCAMVAQGEAAALVAERVWQELAHGLMEARPSRMFDVLQACGAIALVLPQWATDFNSSATQVMRALDLSAVLQSVLPVRFACLCLHLGSAGAVTGLCQHLRVPTECRELAQAVTREHANLHGCGKLDAAALVRLLERCDAFRKPARFAEILLACECQARARTAAPYPQRQRMLQVLAAAQTVSTKAVATRAQAAGLAGQQVGELIHAERVTAVAAMA